MIKLRRIAAFTLVSLSLASCSNNSGNTAAPISSVGGGNSDASSTPSIAPVSRSAGRSTPAPAYPTAASISANNSSANNSAPANVETNNGRIVYNRSYGNIPKGSYNGGSTYTVKRGDTLFYIAWITGNDFRDLAARNNINEPYSLEVGQSLQTGGSSNSSAAPVTTTPVAPVLVPSNGGMLANNNTSGGLITKPTSSTQTQSQSVETSSSNGYSVNSGKPREGKMLPSPAGTTTTTVATAPVTAPASVVSNSAPVSNWKWPTDGKIIDNFSSAEGGNKGIDISGSRGQAIFATANGRVVYAGNALRGYGNLIIIKHNDDYLSAYAHNDTMLVREQQEVQAGQKIATMGSTGTSSVRLHFEIRYKGKSVNPLRFLPQQ